MSLKRFLCALFFLFFVIMIDEGFGQTFEDEQNRKASQLKPVIEDEQNRKDRQLAHERLFKEFIEGKECVFSKDGSLAEVVIYDKPKTIRKEHRFILPKATRDVLRNFDQLVIRGQSAGSVPIIVKS